MSPVSSVPLCNAVWVASQFSAHWDLQNAWLQCARHVASRGGTTADVLKVVAESGKGPLRLDVFPTTEVDRPAWRLSTSAVLPFVADSIFDVHSDITSELRILESRIREQEKLIQARKSIVEQQLQELDELNRQ